MKTDDCVRRDKALEVLCAACGNCACPSGKIPRCSYYEQMQAIPTADVEPVIHGYWYFRGGRPCCSVCSTKALLKDEGGTGGFSHEYVGAKSKRCPECGAKMDAESPKEEDDAE